MQTQPNSQPLNTASTLKDILEAAEVKHPQPGQQLTAVRLRLAYEREPTVILVPSALMASINATTSADVCVANNDSAIERAVFKRSYTSMAAVASSLRPLRSSITRRASKASVLVSVVMLSPVVKPSM